MKIEMKEEIIKIVRWEIAKITSETGKESARLYGYDEKENRYYLQFSNRMYEFEDMVIICEEAPHGVIN